MSELTRQEKIELLTALETRAAQERGLPHLHAFPWYRWAKEFFHSTNKINLLCAGNQISKSSSQIRKCIHWATEPSLWPALWRVKPRQFWYMYPSQKQVKIEFETKWSQFLPANEYKTHPVYGWKAEFKNGELLAIKFNSGVTIYFKTYTQDASVLQSATVDSIFADEEMPEDLYPELIMRLTASNGYFHMVFTATLGQEFWRKAIEPGEHEVEMLPEAAKWQVGMYDCQFYEDGTLTHWTKDHIQTIINRCGTQEEILKRVYGRFILDKGGKKYHEFNLKNHMRQAEPLPFEWNIFEGVDVGSGKSADRKGHPSAIAFVAVNQKYTRARVFLGWRGDYGKTTAGDVFQKHMELKKELPRPPLLQLYDYAAADFKTIADSQGEPFMGAEKSHEIGEQILNTLFKNNMLTIDDTDELRKLGIELTHLRKDQPKNKAKDDFVDALRYAVTKIPWDWSIINGEKPASPAPVDEVTLTPLQREIMERRKAFETEGEDETDVGKEIQEFNELYGA